MSINKEGRIGEEKPDLTSLSKTELINIIEVLYTLAEKDRDNEATVIAIIKQARAMSKEALNLYGEAITNYEDALATLR